MLIVLVCASTCESRYLLRVCCRNTTANAPSKIRRVHVDAHKPRPFILFVCFFSPAQLIFSLSLSIIIRFSRTNLTSLPTQTQKTVGVSRTKSEKNTTRLHSTVNPLLGRETREAGTKRRTVCDRETNRDRRRGRE